MTVTRLLVAPVSKPRMTRSDRWKQRPAVMRYRAYCDELRRRAGVAGLELPEEFDVEFVVPMPRSWSKRKRRELEGRPHQQKPDVDNLLKGLMDALLEEDGHVWDVSARKVWGVDGEVRITERGAS